METYTDQEMTAELCPLRAAWGNYTGRWSSFFFRAALLRNLSQMNHFYYPREQSNAQAETGSSRAVTGDDKVS